MKKNIWVILTAIVALNTTTAVFANDNSDSLSNEGQVAVNDDTRSASESTDSDSSEDRA